MKLHEAQAQEKREEDAREQKARMDQLCGDQKARNDRFQADQKARNDAALRDTDARRDKYSANHGAGDGPGGSLPDGGPSPSDPSADKTKDFADELENGAKAMAVGKARDAFEKHTGYSTHVPGGLLRLHAMDDQACGKVPKASSV